MSMEEKIIEHLKNKYNPSAIMLHGSRAIGKAREHSDWDFLMLFHELPKPPDFREIVNGQNIEVISLSADISDDGVINEMGTKLQNARLVFDSESNGDRVLKAAKAHYAKGFSWPDTWPNGPKLFMASKIDGMGDYVGEPEIFQKYLGTFYERALNYWYQVLHKKFSQPVYLAVETIKDKDPEYFAHLSALASSSVTNQEKIDHAQKIHGKLFGFSNQKN